MRGLVSLITTTRLVLRSLVSSDAPDVLAYRGRSDVCRFLEFEPMDAPTVDGWIADRLDPSRPGEDGGKYVLAVDLDGRVIGDVTMRFGPLVNHQGEVGWIVHPEYAGLGYATEAARAFIDKAFTEWDLHRICAQLDPRNESSARLCERLGMRKEAHLREESWFKGEWGDLAIYAVLKSEWSGH
jgi:RimJ/RimL family protein N-acetyltransferase